MKKTDKIPENATITREPFPNSRKVYVKGELNNISVAMREVQLSNSELSLPIYDTSGPYTDPEAPINVKAGLPAFREEWIRMRNDVQNSEEHSFDYTNGNGALNGFHFENKRQSLCAK